MQTVFKISVGLKRLEKIKLRQIVKIILGMQYELHINKETKKDHCSYTFIMQIALANFSLLFHWKKVRNYLHPLMMKILI